MSGSDVTDADRERAVQVLGYSQLTYDEIFADSEPHERALADAMAAALAEERAKARAPFLALAEDLSRHGDQWAEKLIRDALDGKGINR